MSGFSPEVRAYLLARANGRCEADSPECLGGADNCHHRKPRGMGGTKREWVNRASNGLVLCGSGTTGCHGYFESHRDLAVERGIILPSGLLPWQTPVYLDREWFLLDDHGGRFLITLPPGAEPPYSHTRPQ